MINEDEKKLLKKLNNIIQKQQTELEKKDNMINEMTKFISDLKVAHFKKEEGGEFLGKYRCYNEVEWKQYFESKIMKDKEVKK